MAVFSDTFTESSHTTLASHTPDVGTSWTQIINVGSDLAVNATDDMVTAYMGDLTDYKDGSAVLSCRVYQEAI